jgi:exodeoxyribonuclease V alpha subunit
MSERIELKLRPIKKLWYDDVTSNGGYSCVTDEKGKVMEHQQYKNFVIKGTLPELIKGFEYNAVVIEKEDKKRKSYYYEVQSIFEDIPTDSIKQRMYLSQIVAESHVNALYDAYPNEDIVDLIKNEKLDVNKVKGVGKKILNKIKDKIEQNVEYREAIEFFGQYKISPNLIVKLVKHFKSSKLAVKKVQDSPYNLLAVKGIGFKKADAIAMKMQFPKDHEDRISSAIEYLVEENEKEGHTYINHEDLIDAAYELLGVSKKVIKECIKDTDEIGVYGDCVARKKTYGAEKYISNRLKEMVKNSTELNYDVDKFIIEQEKLMDMNLTEQQRKLFKNIKHYNVNLLVGFAGCGKSALQKLVINLLDQLGMSYLLLAPTGKASRVLSEYTQRKSMTIHKAVQLKDEDEEESKSKMLMEDFIIVDEASMLDVKLASVLLSRIGNPNARLLFIGDSFQIPSVQCGLFLHDCIESNVIPTTMLDIVFRQKEGGILDVMTKVRLKEKFIANDEWGLKEYGDNCVIAAVPQEKMEGGYKYFYNKMLEVYKPEDIMVLSPTKKGNLGTFKVNSELQTIVNPEENSKVEMKFGVDPEIILRDNDYIMNTVNTYKIENMDDREVNIVNGDVGTIEKINKDEKEIVVDFDFDRIPIPFSKLKQLIHSWCITLHKSQGSGAKCVIMILDKSHKFQLNANLFYTGGTRSKEKLFILSQAETINYAMRRNANMQRNTFLGNMLISKEG